MFDLEAKRYMTATMMRTRTTKMAITGPTFLVLVAVGMLVAGGVVTGEGVTIEGMIVGRVTGAGVTDGVTIGVDGAIGLICGSIVFYIVS